MQKTESNISNKTISDLRKTINKNCYRKCYAVTWFWCLFDLSFYIFFIIATLLSKNPWLEILFGVLAGISASSMFVLAHDMAHGALFKNQAASEILGTLFMLPALNIYRLWCFGHNRVHHGFTSFTPMDWIWRPLSKDEYRKLSITQRLFYRFERSLWGCGFHYLINVWLSKMIFFTPERLKPAEKIKMLFSKTTILLFAIFMGLLGYHFNGILGAISILIIPFLVFNYIISLTIYLHHTNPKIPFFDTKAHWNYGKGALTCTTVLNSNWLIETVILHNILIHTPHHVDIRIPFYQLKNAYKEIKALFANNIHEDRLSFKLVSNTFKTCKLYDFEKNCWLPFKEK